MDTTTRNAFELALDRAVDSGLDLVIDLSELTFIDAAGLRNLARAADRMRRAGRRMRLVRPSPYLLRLLRLVDLEHLTR